LLQSWNITYRRCTHKAQNTRHCALVIDNFQRYVNEKIKLLEVSSEAIFNCDQTNCYFHGTEIHLR
jgi:hypothetical protein